MIKHLCTFILFITLCIDLFAGSFIHLSIKDGLSSRQVFRMCKDSTGFIWIYTHIGIDRYDGNEIKHYTLDEAIESKDHILSSTIMTCDRQGNLWIALKNGKIYAYDRQTDTFRRQADLAHSFSSPVLNDILFDDENRLLACTSTGVYLWNSEENSWSFAGLKNAWVNCVVQVGSDTYYVGTNTCIYKLKKDVRGNFISEELVDFPVKSHIESLYVHGQELYVGTFSNGAFVVNLLSGKVKSLSEFVPNVPIRAFARTKDNTILIGADGAGIFQIDVADKKLINHYVANEDDTKSLNGNTVSDICVDEYGVIWVGTSTNGISYLDPSKPDIRRSRHERNNSNSLISDHVNVLLQDSEGDCWYGTNEGISLYRPELNKWTHFLNEKNDIGHPSVILSLCEDNRGNIWAGGYGVGLYCINKNSGRVQKMPQRNEYTGKGISTAYIYAIYSEGDNLWFGGIEGEFVCYNMRMDTYTYYPIDCVGDIESGGKDILLIAGCNGLGFFNKSTGEIKWQQKFGDTTLKYPIRCLLRASSGEIWLATDGEGLIRFNPAKNESYIYTTNDGLTSNSINSLVEDDKGCIWFNTEKDLYCLDLSKDIIVDGNDLLNIDWGYYNPNAALKQKDGNLSFGTAEGILTFVPSFHLEQQVPVKLIFTDFKLLHHDRYLLSDNIDDTQRIELKYTQNSFSISFSAVNFVAPHKIRYEYQLENYDNRRTCMDVVQSVNYMDLSPGKYIFRLKAFDKYTRQQVGERDIEIIICRSFWTSLWAWLIYSVVISAFIFLVVQFWRHRINENRTKDKIRSFISIAHDIRTPVTLIKAPLSELETHAELPEESKKAVAIAIKNAEKLFEMVTQLLNLQNTELHSGHLEVALYDVRAYLEGKLSEFRMAAAQKGVELYLEVAPDVSKVWFDKDKMDHIVDNLLSNALKYTEKGAICIFSRKNKKWWSIEVTDTGVGIPKDEQKNVFHEYYRARNVADSQEQSSGIGLMIIRRLVRQHHGKISFSSIENKGTSFTVMFPQKIKSAIIVESEEKWESASVNSAQENEQVGKNVLLLAEDDKDMREYLTDSLSSEYKVISVPDGGKALEVAREINPDIIISDVIMPILQGDELCRILKSSIDTSHIPIVLLTALCERENIILGLESGANDYIIKPFDLSVLKVRLRNILQSREHLREVVLSSDVPLNEDEVDYGSQLDKEFLDKVMEVVEIELVNPEFSISDFCRMLGMSRTSAFNKIKTLTGQGPNDFIRIVRLNKSKELLASRRYSISEVASMVGFSDPKYFSTCFKKQFGTSPSKF